MIEVVIAIVAIFVFVSGGLVVWRFMRGPAQQRPGLTPRIAILSLIGILLVSTSAWKLSKSRTFQFFGGIVPEEVLSILREQEVKATFFVTGQALEENTAAAQRIVAEGHELGNHSYSHQHMMLKSYSFIQREIEKTDQLIRATGYAGDIHFRSPYGKKLILLPYYLSRTGRLNIFMDVEPESYPEIAADADRIVEHVLTKTRPGSIILLHVMAESRTESRKAIPGIIQGLKEQGYSFVTVSELHAMP
jgi:peptidoglycan/xylan/chitin deacetylase (PgdA/CDA1 family)